MPPTCDNCQSETSGRFCCQCGKPTSADVEPWDPNSAKPVESWREQIEADKRKKEGLSDTPAQSASPKPVVPKINSAEAKAKSEARQKRMAEQANKQETPRVVEVKLRSAQKPPPDLTTKPKSPRPLSAPLTFPSSSLSISPSSRTSSHTPLSSTHAETSSKKIASHETPDTKEVRDLSLSSAHVSALCKIALRGVVLIVCALFFMGTIAPQYLDLDLHRACNIAGVCHILLLSLLFLNSYKSNVAQLSNQDRIMGFIIFWFYASLTFNLTWQLPLWNINFIRNVKLLPENLWWAIVWWSYTVSDKVYHDKTPIMISVEVFWFLGNFFGVAGLARHRQGAHSEALVFFMICGILQCYNATLYIFMTWYVDNFTPIGPEVLDKVVFWGFNCLWAILSAVAAFCSYRLLLPRLVDKK